ncbi:hypothetical protein [Pseudomonas sp.]|uniref:hypothetical protein n=1 Tax=Pseudomonas sp. TaxID=306 RepID=UPI00262FC5FD|nr:hypothetical protein [Pseudomonas sp.]
MSPRTNGRKNPLSKIELLAIFQRVNSPTSFSVKLSMQMNGQGKASPLLMQQPLDTSPERLAQAEKIASFVFIQHTTLNKTGNPYDALSRDELSDIYYDETGNHTPAERYLAGFTRQGKDFEFMTRNTGNSGTSYRALIAFYDATSPVERSMIPEGDREQLLSFLKDAEDNRYPNTGETILDPWMTKYFRKPNTNAPIAQRTLIQPLPAKTIESVPSNAKKQA